MESTPKEAYLLHLPFCLRVRPCLRAVRKIMCSAAVGLGSWMSGVPLTRCRGGLLIEACTSCDAQKYVFDQLVGGKPGFAEFHLTVGPYDALAGDHDDGDHMSNNYIDVDAANVVCEV